MSSNEASFEAGKAAGRAQEKSSQLRNDVSTAAQSAKDSCVQAGQHIKDTAVSVTEVMKDKVGLGKK
ncbi:stress-responsive protein (KIN2) / stress-induced protein (KIN2) / cold-responsive protein (COR6.6) / cold-regulated protein (COR6.6) [Euphorbia peplus]|nr:stress-responsive protein (KIN2) / stress-induced protein (KIN2) / cold-responsive protein (COR6.6) / cold-regulated protein (COR6.6) [Euphorbia peplus]